MVVSKPDEQGVVIVESLDEVFGGVYKRVSITAIKKPKTPEEEFRDELSSDICELVNMDASNNAFVDMLIEKYNITKKQ
jgi:hypothetical protein